MIVLDASAVVELLLRTPRGERIADRVFGARESMHAPHLIDIELSQALRRLALLKAISAERIDLALTDYDALIIERHDHVDLLARIWQLRRAITAYDAAYVSLAEVIAAPLLTCDAKLARVRGHDALVELF